MRIFIYFISPFVLLIYHWELWVVIYPTIGPDDRASWQIIIHQWYWIMCCYSCLLLSYDVPLLYLFFFLFSVLVQYFIYFLNLKQHESMGPKGGYSNFVFKQLCNIKQFSKLMRLGEEFPEELLTFLKQHRDLLWLHQVFLHQFSSASETLHLLSLSQNDSSMSASEGAESFDNSIEATLSNRKHLLHLSKIAAVAGLYYILSERTFGMYLQLRIYP